MPYDVPDFVRIEHWSVTKGDWYVMHAGLNLMNPQKYVQKVTDSGKAIARAIIVDTGQVVLPDGEWDLL